MRSGRYDAGSPKPIMRGFLMLSRIVMLSSFTVVACVHAVHAHLIYAHVDGYEALGDNERSIQKSSAVRA